MSQSFGSVDNEGWAYDSTFDRLIEKIRARRSSGTDSATMIVRRRRHIRARTCVTAEAKSLLQERTSKLLSVRNRFDAALSDKNTDYALTAQYDRERARICAEAFTQCSNSISTAIVRLQDNINKLENVKQVL